ncbi:urease accessory protein [Faunimonas pinastri]|uniref:Urease accessory protein n=1 Tax=Faunimonas pinastri TaxID=1855383 RepID=A0A1H9KS32_9HYPH|nr:HupE/UreJ family protein [Faunimonas pinastri]SER01981.1 urease accessory protein [Faunimonas pinastri]
MTRTKLATLAGATFTAAAIPGIASAHPAIYHVMSFMAGAEHPLTGLDHILAMVAVGLWASLKGGKALWAWPAAFVGVMLVGGALGMAGIPMPLVEPGIAASIVVLGLLVASAAEVPVAIGAVLIGVFALFHGHAHGAEMPATGQAVHYALGFALATAALHGVGIAAGFASRGQVWRNVIRFGGAATAAAGAMFFLV